MISNVEIFLDFLANNFSLEKYIVAYTKRYDVCHTPFLSRIRSKANSNPKGLFTDVLGNCHKFKELEKKWIEYVDNSINYVPAKGDFIYVSFYDEEHCCLTSWVDQFWEGTKERYTNVNGDVEDKHTFVRRATETEINKYNSI